MAVPAYNERASLPGVLAGVRASLPQLDILVVDDGSCDGTADLLADLGVLSSRHLCNLGYGKAIQTALLFAHRHDYDYVLTIDADGQHPPEEVPALLEFFLASQVDLCIGSRFVVGQRYRGVPLGRRLGMYSFSLLSRLLTGRRFFDTTSGLKAIRGSVFPALVSGSFVDFHVEAIVYLDRLGFRVAEHPVAMRERQRGQSMYSPVSAIAYPLKTLLVATVALVQASLARRRLLE